MLSSKRYQWIYLGKSWKIVKSYSINMKIWYQVKSPRFTVFHTITVIADDSSRIGEKYSISHHLGDKSQSGAFYPPNISLCTTLVDGCIHKSYTVDFIWVNYKNLWSHKALIGKIRVNSSHSYFYPKNCQVSTSKELSKTKKKHKFSLNSVNGGHSFFVSNKIEFFIISSTLATTTP